MMNVIPETRRVHLIWYLRFYYHYWLDNSAGGPISPRGYHPPSSECFYHWLDNSAGGLLVPEGIIRLVVSVSITGWITLLVDY